MNDIETGVATPSENPPTESASLLSVPPHQIGIAQGYSECANCYHFKPSKRMPELCGWCMNVLSAYNDYIVPANGWCNCWMECI
jgi:hypothetical protein